MTELNRFIESAYEAAKKGEWTRVLAEWAELPLLARRCSRYQRPRSGWTFLHQAAYFGHEAASRELLRLGASADTRSKDQRTPQDIARQKGHAGVAALLQRASQDPNSLWKPSADPDLRPGSNLWEEAQERRAEETMFVAYAGAPVLISRGARHFVDSFERVLIGWHGTFDPPAGMDGDSMV